MKNNGSSNDSLTQFQELLDPDNINAMEKLLQGESGLAARSQASILQARYGSIRPELEQLHAAIKYCLRTLKTVTKDAYNKFDPEHKRFDPSRANLEDLSLFKFIRTLGQQLIARTQNSETRLSMIDWNLNILLPILSGKQLPNVGSLSNAETAGAQAMSTIQQELQDAVFEFDKMVAGIYLLTRSEYRKLRRKFLGAAAGEEEKDELEDSIFSQLFGGRQPKSQTPLGPGMALVDENCVLTQLLIDASNDLPKPYKRVIPILKHGIPTGRTRSSKQLDEGEVEEYSHLLMGLSNPVYQSYINEPQELQQAAISILSKFFNCYSEVAEKLVAVVEKSGAHIKDTSLDRKMTDPALLKRQYLRINFLSIRPNTEDITPRSKMERDYEAARTKLFLHMRETINALSGMERDEDETEKYAILRTNEAIKLKEEMDDVIKTQQQKELARNIRDDNEFYVSKSGNLGSFDAEREAAPKIKYEDVIGESFVKARGHIEEVIEVASHPQVMRITSPRGDVKSNILLIGSVGSGKTEIMRAVCADRRIIGLSVATADLLTAYMHESVKNIKRLFDKATDLRRKSRNTKPVGIAMDEFDRLFSYGEGVHAAYDGDRMSGTMQEMMDGVVGHEGVFLICATNFPDRIPDAILRRFKSISIVGHLTTEERVKLFKMFLGRGLPVDESIPDSDWTKWGDMMIDAPGDVIGKVADEIHFKFIKECMSSKEKSLKLEALERKLGRRLKDRDITDKDRAFAKREIQAAHRVVVTEEITAALESTLKQPQVQMQIDAARTTYKEAENIISGLSKMKRGGLGFTAEGVHKRSKLFSKD